MSTDVQPPLDEQREPVVAIDDDDYDRDYRPEPSYVQRLIITWGYIVGKNIIGWLLILASVPTGALIPGPGGLPMFLIGFAMISFPGKRNFTARVLAGKQIPEDSKTYHRGVILAALLAPLGLLAYLWQQDLVDLLKTSTRVALSGIIWFILGLGLWSFLWLGRDFINQVICFFPKVRRKVRPWLRRKGIDLLPRRRRRRRLTVDGPQVNDPDPEILEIHERHYARLARVWNVVRPWLKRIIGLGITVAIFYWILVPIRRDWHTFSTEIRQTSPIRFIVASLMFAVFLLFRAISWRRILIGLGHKIPLAPAVRIWSTAELARYIPGSVMQFLGRVYLSQPYGVSGSITTTSQVLELASFLLANVIVACACLLWFGSKELTGPAQKWLLASMGMLPVLALILHPKVFYGVVNRLLASLNKRPIEQRLSGWALLRMLGRMVLALLWQSAAVYILVAPVLGLTNWHWWWQAAGAYCLAWIAGFLAVWAPGGIGVREIVLMAGLQLILKDDVKAQLHDPQVLYAFLAILLRLWTVAGELILTAGSYIADFRGAIGAADAPGRMAPASPQA